MEQDNTIEILGTNTKIWIADNVCINCNSKYTWWNKLFARLLLGWKIEKLSKSL